MLTIAQKPNDPKKKKRFIVPTGSSRELQYRSTLTGWTPDGVESARRAADGGSMQRLADLVETMMTDDRIDGVLSTRTHGLLGLPMDFIGGNSGARETLAGLREGAPGEWWDMHDEAELVQLEEWGLMLGVGLAQRIPLPRLANEMQRYRIETWHPRNLTYYYNQEMGAHWTVNTANGPVPVIPGDGQWILYTPYGVRRPWARGKWRSCAFPWLLKRFCLEDRANYSEVLGQPIWVGKSSTGSTQKQRDLYLSELIGVGKAGKFVLPPGWDLDLKEATGKSYEIYEGQVKWADEAITISLAGQLVTTEGTAGFSSGDIHDNIKQDLIRFDAERLATCLRRQSLRPWAIVNYGKSSAAPWPQWQTKQPDDISEKAGGLKSLGEAIATLDAALKPHGIKVNAEKMCVDANIPLLTVSPEAPSSPAPTERTAQKVASRTIAAARWKR